MEKDQGEQQQQPKKTAEGEGNQEVPTVDTAAEPKNDEVGGKRPSIGEGDGGATGKKPKLDAKDKKVEGDESGGSDNDEEDVDADADVDLDEESLGEESEDEEESDDEEEGSDAYDSDEDGEEEAEETPADKE